MAILIGLVMWLAENAGRKQKDLGHVSIGGRAVHRHRAGAGDDPRRLAQRHHYFRRTVSQPGPGGGGSIFVPALTPTIAGVALKKF